MISPETAVQRAREEAWKKEAETRAALMEATRLAIKPAQLSLDIYKPLLDFKRMTARQFGIPEEAITTYNKNHGQAALVRMENETPPRLMIAVRGTEPNGSDALADWETNLDKDMVEGPGGAMVHEGFLRSANGLWFSAHMGRDIHNFMKEYPDAEIIITGHSQGAAVASVLAARMIEKGYGPQMTRVTFGEVTSGDDAYAEFVSKGIKTHMRYVRFSDPVPDALGKGDGYRHIGPAMLFKQGELIGAATQADLFTGNRETVEENLAGAHDMALYLRDIYNYGSDKRFENVSAISAAQKTPAPQEPPSLLTSEVRDLNNMLRFATSHMTSIADVVLELHRAAATDMVQSAATVAQVLTNPYIPPPLPESALKTRMKEAIHDIDEKTGPLKWSFDPRHIRDVFHKPWERVTGSLMPSRPETPVFSENFSQSEQGPVYTASMTVAAPGPTPLEFFGVEPKLGISSGLLNPELREQLTPKAPGEVTPAVQAAGVRPVFNASATVTAAAPAPLEFFGENPAQRFSPVTTVAPAVAVATAAPNPFERFNQNQAPTAQDVTSSEVTVAAAAPAEPFSTAQAAEVFSLLPSRRDQLPAGAPVEVQAAVEINTLLEQAKDDPTLLETLRQKGAELLTDLGVEGMAVLATFMKAGSQALTGPDSPAQPGIQGASVAVAANIMQPR